MRAGGVNRNIQSDFKEHRETPEEDFVNAKDVSGWILPLRSVTKFNLILQCFLESEARPELQWLTSL